AELAPVLDLLDARQPLDLQLAAIRVFGAADGPEVVPALLKNWAGYSPNVQLAVLDVVFGRQDRLAQLLDSIAQQGVDPSGIPPLRQAQLLQNPHAAIRDRAKTILAGRASSEDRKRVLARYQECLTLPRDSKRGKAVFDQQCAKCHQLQGQGTAVGPDL